MRDAQLKEAVDDISRQSGVLTSSNDLTWKKLQFARPEESKVSLEHAFCAEAAPDTGEPPCNAVHRGRSNRRTPFRKALTALATGIMALSSLRS